MCCLSFMQVTSCVFESTWTATVPAVRLTCPSTLWWWRACTTLSFSGRSNSASPCPFSDSRPTTPPDHRHRSSRRPSDRSRAARRSNARPEAWTWRPVSRASYRSSSSPIRNAFATTSCSYRPPSLRRSDVLTTRRHAAVPLNHTFFATPASAGCSAHPSDIRPERRPSVLDDRLIRVLSARATLQGTRW